MTIKQQIKYGTIQNVCRVHNDIFHLIQLFHNVNFTLPLPLRYSVNFTKKLHKIQWNMNIYGGRKPHF